MTAALERLLDVEVGATEARKLASRLRFACLPEPWTINALAEGADGFGDLDEGGQPGALGAADPAVDEGEDLFGVRSPAKMARKASLRV